jgi:predicted nucleotidyltransferase
MNWYRSCIWIKGTWLRKFGKELLKETTGVKEAYIYGSYAHNNMDVHSDIDVLPEFCVKWVI